MKVTLTISPYDRQWKPNMKSEYSILSDHSQAQEYSVSEIAQFVGNKGRSFSHAAFRGDGKISSSNFLSSQLLVMDFDGKNGNFSPVLFLERLDEYGLRPNIIYRSFSDKTPFTLPDDEKLRRTKKYRAIFVLDELVTDVEFYDRVLRDGGYLFFSEADHAPHKVQIWAGGNDLIYLDTESTTSVLALMNAAHAFATRNSKSSQAKGRIYEELLQGTTPNEYSDGCGSNMASCNSVYIQPAENEPTSPIRNFNWAEARLKCRLLDEFLSCSRKIFHNELLGLYTAMKFIRGGSKKWKKAVEANPMIDDVKIMEIAQWVDKHDRVRGVYKEMHLKKYAPDDPAAQKYKRLTEVCGKRNQEAQLLESHNQRFISLKEAGAGMAYLFNHVLSKWDSKIAVLKVATGVGKTWLFCKCQHLDECIIAVPTHDLKNEISQRLTVEGIEHHVIPILPELPDSIRKVYEGYLAIGKYDYAAGFLRSLIHGDINKYGLILSDAAWFRFKMYRYFAGINRAVEDSIPVITTHDRIFHTDFPNHSTLIVDEDIIETFCEVNAISLKSIRLAIPHIKDDQCRKILEDIVVLSTKPENSEVVIPFNSISRNHYGLVSGIPNEAIEKLIKAGITDDIVSLFRAEHLIFKAVDWNDPHGEKELYYSLRNAIPADKRMIILSATAGEFMYSKLFPGVDFFDLSMVEIKGKGIQYSNRSFSRRSFDSKATIALVKRIAEITGGNPTITYKGGKFQKYFHNPFRHIEDIEGTDELRGSNISVVATPFHSPSFYKIWGALLGIDFSEGTEFTEQQVEHNGYIFNIVTFANQNLREIQFHFIESRLMQAVGRSRLVRENATVNLFSSYPLIGFEQRHLKELVNADIMVTPSNTDYNSGQIVAMEITSGSKAS